MAYKVKCSVTVNFELERKEHFKKQDVNNETVARSQMSRSVCERALGTNLQFLAGTARMLCV